MDVDLVIHGRLATCKRKTADDQPSEVSRSPYRVATWVGEDAGLACRCRVGQLWTQPGRMSSI